MDYLKIYNKEFNSFDDINNIIKAFNEDINNEIISGLFESPNTKTIKFQKNLWFYSMDKNTLFLLF